MRTDEEIGLEQLELELLLDGLYRRWGYDLRSYSRASLGRRLRGLRASVEGASSFSALQHLVLRDAGLAERLMAEVSMHSFSLFRAPATFRAFREHVVPWLRTYPFVRLWVAGCGSGEDVWSLAIVLAEEGLGDRARIYATDVSNIVLARAWGGVLSGDAVQAAELDYAAAGGNATLHEHFTSDGEERAVRHDLRRNVVFFQHDLGSDASLNEFHVVFCRDVMIYFDDVLRERAHRLLHASLLRSGVLGLGAKETLQHTSYTARYEGLGHSLYRRVG